jgi:hypothetical protein
MSGVCFFYRFHSVVLKLAVYLYFRLIQHTLNILFYTQATCFDLQEVIIRPFKDIKPKITVLACTWDPSVTSVAETVLNQIGKQD